MRTTAALFAGILAAVAQEGAETRTRFAFSVEQGWSLTTDTEGDFPDIQENDLQEGLNPRFRPPLTRPSFPTRDRDNRPRPRGSARGSRIVRTTKDPLKLEGTVDVFADGACRLRFSRIEYWDRTQRYWIELQEDKVRTFDLGGLGKWSGSRPEWDVRRVKLETAFLDAYLKVLTPQRPAAAPDRIGLEGSSAPEPAWRLFVATSLEEQLAALLLARVDGLRIDRTSWEADAFRMPERPQQLARGLLDRILAQASGTFAPAPARARPGRTLKDQEWTGTEVAVPTPGWMNGRAWAAERLKPVEDARARLRAIVDETSRTGFGRSGYADVDAWRSAVEDEAKQLRKHYAPLAVPDRAPTFEDALPPRFRSAGPATYDFKEKTELRDGLLHSSDATVLGTSHDVEAVFFHSGLNVWRVSFVKLETWYRGKVQRT